MQINLQCMFRVSTVDRPHSTRMLVHHWSATMASWRVVQRCERGVKHLSGTVADYCNDVDVNSTYEQEL